MSYKIVILDANYAGEFDVTSLWLAKSEEVDTFFNTLNQLPELDYPLFIGFGNNEDIEFGSKQEIINSLSIKDISDTTYNELVESVFPYYGFGPIDIPYILERYMDIVEEEEEKEEEEE